MLLVPLITALAVATALKDASGQDADVDVHRRQRQRRQARDAAPPPPPPPPLLCRRATGEELIVDAARALARLPQEGSRKFFKERNIFNIIFRYYISFILGNSISINSRSFGRIDVRLRLPDALQGPDPGPRFLGEGGRRLPSVGQDELRPEADSQAMSETSCVSGGVSESRLEACDNDDGTLKIEDRENPLPLEILSAPRRSTVTIRTSRSSPTRAPPARTPS